MTNEKIFNHFKNLDKEIKKMTKDKVFVPKGYTKKQWNKLSETEKLQVIMPNGIWQEEQGEEK